MSLSGVARWRSRHQIILWRGQWLNLRRYPHIHSRRSNVCADNLQHIYWLIVNLAPAAPGGWHSFLTRSAQCEPPAAQFPEPWIAIIPDQNPQYSYHALTCFLLGAAITLNVNDSWKNWRLFYPEIKNVAPKKQPSRLLKRQICRPNHVTTLKRCSKVAKATAIGYITGYSYSYLSHDDSDAENYSSGYGLLLRRRRDAR